MARTCLMGALVSVGVGADSVRKIAEEIIALDSLNLKAAVIRAKAYDAEGRTASDTAPARRTTVSGRSGKPSAR